MYCSRTTHHLIQRISNETGITWPNQNLIVMWKRYIRVAIDGHNIEAFWVHPFQICSSSFFLYHTSYYQPKQYYMYSTCSEAMTFMRIPFCNSHAYTKLAFASTGKKLTGIFSNFGNGIWISWKMSREKSCWTIYQRWNEPSMYASKFTRFELFSFATVITNHNF